MDLNTPQVMGILNVTPDSFYSGSRKQTEEEIANRANQIIARWKHHRYRGFLYPSWC